MPRKQNSYQLYYFTVCLRGKKSSHFVFQRFKKPFGYLVHVRSLTKITDECYICKCTYNKSRKPNILHLYFIELMNLFGFTIHVRSLTKMTGKYCIYKHSKSKKTQCSYINIFPTLSSFFSSNRQTSSDCLLMMY